LREGGLTEPSEIKPGNECEDAIQSEKLAADNTGQHTKCIRNQKVDSSSLKCAETKYGFRIQFLALVFMIYEMWLNA